MSNDNNKNINNNQSKIDNNLKRSNNVNKNNELKSNLQISSSRNQASYTGKSFKKSKFSEKPILTTDNNNAQQVGLYYIQQNRVKRKYSIKECLINNFLELHPICSLCKVSFITPAMISSWFFMFNTLNLLGLNALIYMESSIEKRIFDEKRDKFDYPMKREFGKIILSILLEIAFAAVFRFILLINLKQRRIMKGRFDNCSNQKELLVIAKSFDDSNFIKRLIVGIVMMGWTLFLWIYTIGFCGFYVNTQRNLLYGWIWSLFWNWIIFAPIYIVVVSVLESMKRNANCPVVYYMKKLFIF